MRRREDGGLKRGLGSQESRMPKNVAKVKIVRKPQKANPAHWM
jgi:hypothetical protein